jgi:hypothetical protein
VGTFRQTDEAAINRTTKRQFSVVWCVSLWEGRRVGRADQEQQPPPQQPPAAGAAPRPPEFAASPATATVDSSFTVSSCPCGQDAGALDALIGRFTSKVSPQARQRYS